MVAMTNKVPITDQSYSLLTRTVTCKVEQELYTNNEELNDGDVYDKIFRAIAEILDHVENNLDIKITGGNFHFKLDHADYKPILIFASQI